MLDPPNPTNLNADKDPGIASHSSDKETEDLTIKRIIIIGGK
jgi:hypothetical protein